MRSRTAAAYRRAHSAEPRLARRGPTRASGRFLPACLYHQDSKPSRQRGRDTEITTLYTSLTDKRESPQSAIQRILMESVTRPTWRARASTMEALLDTNGAEAPVSSLSLLLSRRMASVAPTTVHKDLSNAKWAFQRILPAASANQVQALISDLQRGLRRVAARRRKTKALPMTVPVLRRFLVNLSADLRALVLLAFRTASRVGEILELEKCNVTSLPETKELMVSFVTSKTNREGDRRPDHRIMVADPEPEILAHLHRAKSGRLWTARHKAELRTALYRFKPDHLELATWQKQAPEENLRRSYGFHSFKRGAAALAWEALQRREITSDDLMLLLKHKDIRSSLEYCPVPLTAARSVGSRATQATRVASLTTPSL